MTNLTTRFGARLTVDRDYAGAIGEDVEVRLDHLDLDAPPQLFLSPDEADEFAAALTYHAAEVRQINKEADRGLLNG